MTDTLDLAALKRTARAAWDAYDAPIESDGWTYLRYMEAFRNAHTPAAALALIARVEAAERNHAEVVADYQHLLCEFDKDRPNLEVERDAVLARRAPIDENTP